MTVTKVLTAWLLTARREVAVTAREVAVDAMTEHEFQRLANQIVDQARDEDSSLTRAERDPDRATPRDVRHVDSDRLRGDLPARKEFREALSGRQRKIRSTVKNQVVAAAPASQHRVIRSMLVDEDPGEWRRINELCTTMPATSSSCQTTIAPRFSASTGRSNPMSGSTIAPTVFTSR